MLSAIGAQEYELLGDYHLNHGIHGLQLAGLWLLREATPNFGQSIVQLTAAMAAEMYGRSSSDNAGLVAAFGLGSVVSGVITVALGAAVRRSSTIQVGMVLYVAGIVLIPLTTSYEIGLLGMFVCGLAHIPVATTCNTFMQSSVPDEYRGRVVSCYLTGVMLGMPLGSFLLGRLGDVLGMRETMVLDALVMAVFAVVIVVVYGGMRFVDHVLVDHLEAGAAVPAR